MGHCITITDISKDLLEIFSFHQVTVQTKASKTILFCFSYCCNSFVKQWNSLPMAIKLFISGSWWGKISFAFQNKKAENADRLVYIQTIDMYMSSVGSGISSKAQNSVLFNIAFIFWRSVLWFFKSCIFLATLCLSLVNTSTNHLLEQSKLFVIYAEKPCFKSFVKGPIEALWQNYHKTFNCLSWSIIPSTGFPHQTEERCLPHSLINCGLFNKSTQSTEAIFSWSQEFCVFFKQSSLIKLKEKRVQW